MSPGPQHPRENLQCRSMSSEEFATLRATTLRQLEAFASDMEFPRIIYGIGALISLMAAELPAPMVQAFMDRAKKEALAANPEQLVAGK